MVTPMLKARARGCRLVALMALKSIGRASVDAFASSVVAKLGDTDAPVRYAALEALAVASPAVRQSHAGSVVSAPPFPPHTHCRPIPRTPGPSLRLAD